jgi:hypothetical protein
LIAPGGTGDPHLNLWILGWDLQALTNRPSSFINGSVFNANIFHPATNTLAYADNFSDPGAPRLACVRLTHDLVLCYNVLLLLSLVADAMAMYLLVRALTEIPWCRSGQRVDMGVLALHVCPSAATAAAGVVFHAACVPVSV